MIEFIVNNISYLFEKSVAHPMLCPSWVYISLSSYSLVESYLSECFFFFFKSPMYRASTMILFRGYNNKNNKIESIAQSEITDFDCLSMRSPIGNFLLPDLFGTAIYSWMILLMISGCLVKYPCDCGPFYCVYSGLQRSHNMWHRI